MPNSLLSLAPLFLPLIILLQTLNRKSILMLLLLLECYILASTLLLFLSLTAFSPWFILIILMFAACEAAIGLSLLVFLMRQSGSSSISTLSSLKC